jgi:hypothetical protein
MDCTSDDVKCKVQEQMLSTLRDIHDSHLTQICAIYSLKSGRALSRLDTVSVTQYYQVISIPQLISFYIHKIPLFILNNLLSIWHIYATKPHTSRLLAILPIIDPENVDVALGPQDRSPPDMHRAFRPGTLSPRHCLQADCATRHCT